VSAKVKKAEIKLAECLWLHCSIAAVHHPSETIKWLRKNINIL